jgi:transposase
MRLVEHGYCLYHNEAVTDDLCSHKDERCLSCDYLIRKSKYMTVEEAAELLGKSQGTIRAWIKKGKLKAENYEFASKYSHKTYRYNVYFIERESLKGLEKPIKAKENGDKHE